MVVLPEQLQYILLGLNFTITIALISYAIYLYRIEAKMRNRFNSINENAEKIISEANQKAIEILNSSKYLSKSLKDQTENSFDDLVKNLKEQNKSFYKSLSEVYFDRSKEFVKQIQEENEKDLEEFSKNLSEASTASRGELEKKVAESYAEAEKEILEYKKTKKQEFEDRLKEKVSKIATEVLPNYIKIEDQEKFAKEVIEKASSEGAFK